MAEVTPQMLLEPKQQMMEGVEFKAAYLNVKGYDMTVDHDRHYTYKVPFAIQMRRQPCCTRIGQMLCGCLPCCRSTGPQDIMDFVDQDTGDQIRYHRFGYQVRVFHNGQYKGALTRTWRLCDRMRTCCQEVCKSDIPLVSLWDESGKRFATLTRQGRGCCCTCKPNFPLRCVHGNILMVLPVSFFSICSCTCESYLANPKTSGWPWCCAVLNGIPTGGLPHGLLLCPCLDLACCECCVKGSNKTCGCAECPCCCCPNPCGFCICCCPWAACKGHILPITSTFKYEMGEVKNGEEKVGDFQLHYRGNCPYQSGWVHNQEEPYAVAMETGSGGAKGMVMSALLAAKSYVLGRAAPLLSGVSTGVGSPNFDGKVTTYKTPEVDALLAALDENNRVTKKVTFGSINKKNVRGYTLLKVGYDNAWCSIGPVPICGGLSMKPKYCRDKKTAEEYIANARSGGTRPTFFFEFYLEDPEEGIINRQTARHTLDKRFYDYFYEVGQEKLYLECQCVRFWKFPLDCTKHRFTCCKCGCPDCCGNICLSSKSKATPVAPGSKPAAKPNQIIMVPGKVRGQAWA